MLEQIYKLNTSRNQPRPSENISFIVYSVLKQSIWICKDRVDKENPKAPFKRQEKQGFRWRPWITPLGDPTSVKAVIPTIG